MRKTKLRRSVGILTYGYLGSDRPLCGPISRQSVGAPKQKAKRSLRWTTSVVRRNISNAHYLRQYSTMLNAMQ